MKMQNMHNLSRFKWTDVRGYSNNAQIQIILCISTNYQGPVVQSVVSLTTSLRVISLIVLADPIHNILIFFAEKMWVAFALQKLLTFFSKKFQHICVSLDVNFNESLTNDVVSFEQLGPECWPSVHMICSKQWFYKRVEKVVIRMCGCIGCSGTWLPKYVMKIHFDLKRPI